MIDYFQSQRLAAKSGVPPEIIEKDYFIELVLLSLAKEPYFNEKLVFRGGTALKKIYFSDYRFSEDLDFLVDAKESLVPYKKKLDHVIEKINSEYPYNLAKRFESDSDRLQFFMTYDIIPEIKTVKELKVDILRDYYIPSYRRSRILFSHQAFQHENIDINTYILESVAVDKICRILDVDSEPRDLYDLWYLLKLDIDTGKTKEDLKKKFGHDVYYPNLINAIKNEDLRHNWQIRLAKQIKDLPAYKYLVIELEELIREKLINT